MMSLIEEALREKFFPALFGGGGDQHRLLANPRLDVKHGGLCILEPRLFSKSSYNTSKAASGELVDSLLGGFALNYVGHMACVRKASLAARHTNMHAELGELARRKYLSGGQE